MGGLEVDLCSIVIGTNGRAITGLHAAGELVGGILGNNRLGGNSLLDCVVCGRVARANVKPARQNPLLHGRPRVRLELQLRWY